MQDFVEVEDERLDKNHHVLIGSQTMLKAASNDTHLPVRSGPRVCDEFAQLLESMSPLTVSGTVLPGARFLCVPGRFINGFKFVNQVKDIYKMRKTN